MSEGNPGKNPGPAPTNGQSNGQASGASAQGNGSNGRAEELTAARSTAPNQAAKGSGRPQPAANRPQSPAAQQRPGGPPPTRPANPPQSGQNRPGQPTSSPSRPANHPPIQAPSGAPGPAPVAPGDARPVWGAPNAGGPVAGGPGAGDAKPSLRERLGFAKKPEVKPVTSAESKVGPTTPNLTASAGAPTPANPTPANPTVAPPALPPIQRPEQKRVNPAVGQRPLGQPLIGATGLQTGAATVPGEGPAQAPSGPLNRTSGGPDLRPPRVAPGAPVPGPGVPAQALGTQGSITQDSFTQGPITQPLPIVPGPSAGSHPEAHLEGHASPFSRVGAPRRTRKARLRLSRLDPWSVMKTAFLFSIAAGIMLVIAVYAVWVVLSTSQLFESVNEIVKSVVSTPGDTTPFRVQEYINTQKVLGVAALIAVVDVVILTALATLGSFLYNLAATMLGGLEITLAED